MPDAEEKAKGQLDELREGLAKKEADDKDGGIDRQDALYFGEAGRSIEQLGALRSRAKQLYVRVPPTEQWVENHYYRRPIASIDANLVTLNRFWRDYAAADPAAGFLSPYFPEASRNFTEMMFALAVLDLPFAAAEPKVEFAEGQMTFTPARDVVVFHQQVKPAVFDDRGATC